jgi:hypothetical protein
LDGYVATTFKHQDRKPSTAPQATDEEPVALHHGMIAFAGQYRLEGTRLIYHPEISRYQAWNGGSRERMVEAGADRFETNSLPTISAVTGLRTLSSLVWDRA